MSQMRRKRSGPRGTRRGNGKETGAGKTGNGNGKRRLPHNAGNRFARRELHAADLSHEEDGSRVALANGKNEWTVGTECRNRGTARTHYYDAD